MKIKNRILNFVLAIALIVPMFFLCACGNDDTEGNGNNNERDSSKWFSETELSAVGLSGLTAPTGLSGELYTSLSWFNNGYSFSQPCSDDALLTQNAETYFNYLKTNYNGYFGLKYNGSGVKYGENETWYVLKQSETLSEYFDDNPSKLYKFYYVTNHETDNEGYFVSDSVYSLEIRYEFDTSSNQYKFKLFIEKANKSHNGVFTYHYKMK